VEAALAAPVAPEDLAGVVEEIGRHPGRAPVAGIAADAFEGGLDDGGGDVLGGPLSWFMSG
jgi:hypothetical protein